MKKYDNQWETLDMNQIVGSHHILFISLDALRYDVAKEQEELGNTPVLNRFGEWQKCEAVGNFTYPAHHGMFAGFFPCFSDAKSIESVFSFSSRKMLGWEERHQREPTDFPKALLWRL